jgi:hypothetical protein
MDKKNPSYNPHDAQISVKYALYLQNVVLVGEILLRYFNMVHPAQSLSTVQLVLITCYMKLNKSIYTYP